MTTRHRGMTRELTLVLPAPTHGSEHEAQETSGTTRRDPHAADAQCMPTRRSRHVAYYDSERRISRAPSGSTAHSVSRILAPDTSPIRSLDCP